MALHQRRVNVVPQSNVAHSLSHPGEPLEPLEPLNPPSLACPAKPKRRPAWEAPARPANETLTCLQPSHRSIIMYFSRNILKPLVLREEFGVLELSNEVLAAPSLLLLRELVQEPVLWCEHNEVLSITSRNEAGICACELFRGGGS